MIASAKTCRHRKITAGVAALLLISLTACATPGPGGPSRKPHGHHDGPGERMPWHEVLPDVFLFLPFDADHNQRITKTELSAAIESLWATVSKGRPTLSIIELRDSLAKIYGKRDFDFTAPAFDPEGDGHVTPEKFAAALRRHFDRLDANGDGVLTPDEFYQKANRRR